MERNSISYLYSDLFETINNTNHIGQLSDELQLLVNKLINNINTYTHIKNLNYIKTMNDLMIYDVKDLLLQSSNEKHIEWLNDILNKFEVINKKIKENKDVL